MKKIVFIVPHMICGGVEKALLALVNELPRTVYDITILMVKAEGEFVELIPDFVKYEELPLPKDAIVVEGLKASVKKYIKEVRFVKLAKIGVNLLKKEPIPTLTENFKKLQTVTNHYDIAICFHIHMPFLIRYVAEKICADKHLAWIHNDFKMSGYDVRRYASYLEKYDHFFAVSEQLKEEFNELLPQFREKTSIAHNIISESYVRGALNGNIVQEYPADDTFKILTIGRLDEQKGYDMALKVCSRIRQNGFKIKWFALGSGMLENSIKMQINELGLEETFIMLGIRTNPYPYIDQCDLYVQPSRHEGFGIAVAEARVLFKPIVCTDFIGARDQIVDGVTGSIANFNEEELVKAIEDLIVNSSKREYYAENLKSNQIDTLSEIKKILYYL